MNVDPSEAATGSTNTQARWRLYLVLSDLLQLIGFCMLLNFLLLAGTDVGWLVRGAVIAVVIFAVARWSAWTLLAAIQISLFIREPARMALEHGIDAFIYCLAAILAIAYASSHLLTRRHLGHWVIQSLFLLGAEKRRSVAPTSSGASSLSSSSTSSPPVGHELSYGVDFDVDRMPDRVAALLTLRALMLAVAVLSSMLLFSHLPISSDGREQWWQLSVRSGFTLWPGPTILILAVALIVLVWQNEWRQLTPAQARLMLRSTFLSIHYRDLKMIVTSRLRSRKKSEVIS